MVVSIVRNLGQPCRQQTTKRAGQRCRAVEKADSIDHLMASVEHCQIYNHASQKPTLQQAKEASRNDETSIRLAEAEKRADEAPARYQSWKEDIGLDALDDPIRGHVDEDVGNVKNHEGDIKLVACQTEVLYQAINFGISGIAAIDEGKEPEIAGQ